MTPQRDVERLMRAMVSATEYKSCWECKQARSIDGLFCSDECREIWGTQFALEMMDTGVG